MSIQDFTPSRRFASVAAPSDRSTRRMRPLTRLMLWAAAVRPSVLERLESQQVRYTVLGAAVFTIAGLNAIAMPFAISLARHVPLSRVWPAGLVWGAVVLVVERLIQSGKRGAGSLPLVLVRLIMTFGLSVTVSEPIVMWLLAPEIASFIAQRSAAIQISTLESISSKYGAQIAAEQLDVASWQHKETALEASIAHNTFLYNCEIGLASCSTSKQVGDGPWAQHYAQLAGQEKQQLSAVRTTAGQAIAADRTQIGLLQRDQRGAELTTSRAITDSDGLLAREDALSALAAQESSANLTIWFVRGLMIVVDCAATIAKAGLLLCRKLPYDELDDADQQVELAEAHRQRGKARSERALIDAQTEADIEVNEVLIDQERQRRIDESTGASWASRPTDDFRSAPTVKSMSLADLVDIGVVHGNQPIAVPSPLRAGGWVGSLLLAALFAVITPLQAIGHLPLHGSWLVDLTTAATAGLAIHTRGFRRASGWAQRGIFAVLLLGVAMPIITFLLNV